MNNFINLILGIFIALNAYYSVIMFKMKYITEGLLNIITILFLGLSFYLVNFN